MAGASTFCAAPTARSTAAAPTTSTAASPPTRAGASSTRAGGCRSTLAHVERVRRQERRRCAARTAWKRLSRAPRSCAAYPKRKDPGRATCARPANSLSPVDVENCRPEPKPLSLRLLGCGDSDQRQRPDMTAVVVPHNFDQINTEILQPSCAAFSVCHSTDGARDANMLDLKTDPYAALVGVLSDNAEGQGARACCASSRATRPTASSSSS